MQIFSEIFICLFSFCCISVWAPFSLSLSLFVPIYFFQCVALHLFLCLPCWVSFTALLAHPFSLSFFSACTFVIVCISLSLCFFLCLSLFSASLFLITSHFISSLFLCVCVCLCVSVVCVYQVFNHFRKDSDWPSLGNLHNSQKLHLVHGMKTTNFVPIALIRNRNWIFQILLLLKMTS